MSEILPEVRAGPTHLKLSPLKETEDGFAGFSSFWVFTGCFSPEKEKNIKARVVMKIVLNIIFKFRVAESNADDVSWR
jgi:hypothetical protein